MKIHPNVIAAAILGLSILAASFICALAPQTGRFVYKEVKEEWSDRNYVFDTATGTHYSYSVYCRPNPEDPPLTVWNVTELDDYKRLSKEGN